MQEYTRAQVSAARPGPALVIDNVVYDVSAFQEEHPGGREVLRQGAGSAGADASACFHSVGHSDAARALMQRYAVGRVVQAERWAERERERPPPPEPPGWGAVLDAWTPPLLMALVAVLSYQYLL